MQKYPSGAYLTYKCPLVLQREWWVCIEARAQLQRHTVERPVAVRYKQIQS